MRFEFLQRHRRSTPQVRLLGPSLRQSRSAFGPVDLAAHQDSATAGPRRVRPGASVIQRRMALWCMCRAGSVLLAGVVAVAGAACGGSQRRPRATEATSTPSTRTQTASTTRRGSSPRHVLVVHAVLAHWRLPVARYRTMAVANGRYLFLLGGLDAGGSTVNSVYRIDPGRGVTKRGCPGARRTLR
jgi:hypothetical protein